MSSTCCSNAGRKNENATKQGISCQSVWNVNDVLPRQCLTSDTFVWFRHHTWNNTIFSFYHITLQIRGISTAHQLQQNTKEAILLQLILLPYHICMRSCWAGAHVETPSLVFQCALIADWPEWDCRHWRHFLLQVTSCSIFPHPVLLSRILNGLFQVAADFVTPESVLFCLWLQITLNAGKDIPKPLNSSAHQWEHIKHLLQDLGGHTLEWKERITHVLQPPTMYWRVKDATFSLAFNLVVLFQKTHISLLSESYLLLL